MMEESLNNLPITLELKTTEHCDSDEIFYRYRVGRYVFWFTQHLDNGKKNKHQNCVGCIFQVHIESDDPTDLHIRAWEEVGTWVGYPKEFFLDDLPHRYKLLDIDKYLDKIHYATDCLIRIREFLYNSEHYELFKQREKLKD